MEIRLAANIQYDSIVDGEGMRAVLWTQGCPHHCLGCHNPTTHDFNGGFITTTEELIEELKDELKYEDGITLSGGDPFMQPEAVCEIAKYVKSVGKNVWAYTGFTFEQLLELGKKNKNIINLLNNVDILVDGKFVMAEKSLDLYYMGSRNQRVIEVQESLKKKKAILNVNYNQEKTINNGKNKKQESIFI